MPSTSVRPCNLPLLNLSLQASFAEQKPTQGDCEETLDSYHRKVLIRAVPRPPSGVQQALRTAHEILIPAARMGITPVRWVTYSLHGALSEGIIGGATGIVVGSEMIHLLFQAWQRDARLFQGLPMHNAKPSETAQSSYAEAAIYSAVLVTVLSGSALGASFGIMAGAIRGGVRGVVDVEQSVAAIFETRPQPHLR